MKIIRHVPNTLSIMRIVLSVALVFLIRMPWIFTALYLFIGATDFFDGKIARRYHVESDLGSKLDTLGDTMLFLGAFIGIAFFAHLKYDLIKCLIPVVVCVLHKTANVFLARARFKTWNMMHTLLSKSVGAGVYLCAPVFLLLGEVNFYVFLGLIALIVVTFTDETITLLWDDEFDVNSKGIVGEKLLKLVGRKPEVA